MYAGFVTLVLALLALDLGVFHRKAHVVSVKEALGWSAFWIALGLSFAGFIYAGYENHWLGLGLTPDLMTLSPEVVEGVGTVYNDGASAVVKYVTGYLVEKSLAVDNIFVIAMIFGFFAVPQIYQHRVLFWGILGALVMRGAMIAVGAQLIQRFTWILYVFGAFLILTGDQDALPEGGRDRPQPQRRGPPDPAALPDHGAVPRRALLRPGGVVRLAPGPRPRGGRRRRTAWSTRPGRASSSPPRSSSPW